MPISSITSIVNCQGQQEQTKEGEEESEDREEHRVPERLLLRIIIATIAEIRIIIWDYSTNRR